MISKELLSEVLSNKHIINNKNDLLIGEKEVILFSKMGSYDININIHELAHKCKEWAYESGVTNFLSGQSDYGRRCEFYWGFELSEFQANTEPEAIFKACEWVLENKER